MKGVHMFLIIIAVVVVLGFGIANKQQKNISGNVVSDSTLQTGDQLKVFQGRITNAKLSTGRFEGIATTDKGCGSVGGGLVECNTDIETNQGSINFIYKHNMNIQPCLSMFGKENVIVDILDSNGNAKVTRTMNVAGKMH